MIVALHYCRKDQYLALSLAEWLAEIGPFPNHDFLIFRDARAGDAGFIGGISAKSVNEVVITDEVANSWPASANHAFKKIAKHVQYACKGVPFLLLEPDAVILRASAFDEIEAEYKAAGKPFLGDLIDHRGNKPGANFVLHMSGIGVYPGNMTQHAGEVFYADDKTPWDIAAGPAIHSQAKQSELIFHVWQGPGQPGLAPFKDWQDVEQKIFARRPKCALFHSDKTGTLLRLLRERKNLPVPVLAEIETEPVSSSQAQNSTESDLRASPQADAATDKDDLPSRQFCGGQTPYEATVWPQTNCDYKVTARIEPTSQPRSASIDEIKSIANRLRQSQTDMAKTRLVRQLLHDAGVIKLDYRFKKRKGWKRKKKK